jgi:hypothetical protein
MIHFYGVLLDSYPLSAVCGCLFDIFKATFNIGVPSSIHSLRTCHAMVSGFHLSWLYCILWWIYYNKWFRRCIVIMYKKHYCLLSFLICFIPRIIRRGHISRLALAIANSVFSEL